MGTLIQDLRYGLRGLAKAPLLSLTAILALSAGIGLNAAVFTLLDVTWLRAPVENDPGSFVEAIPSYSGWFDTENQFHGFTVKDFEAIRERSKSLSEIAAFNGVGGAKLDNDSEQSGLGLVTCNFFQVYAWATVKGRVFLPEDCAAPGSSPVVVITESLWRHRFANDPHIVGRVVRINRNPYTVVGVISARAPLWLDGDLWVPYTMQPQFYGGYDGFQQHPDYPWLSFVGRLKPGYSKSEAQAELQLIENQQDLSFPGRKTAVEVTNGSLIQDPETRSFGLMVIPLIMGPMALILLVACINVAMLLLSRAAARRNEIAIRLSLGASRGRLLRMLATEGLIVASAAGFISLYLAYELPGMFWAFFLPQMGFRELGGDWRVFVYLAGATLLAGVIAGLTPARESLKFDLLTSLKGQESTSTTRSRTRSILVVAQIAMCFVLVAAGVLFVRMERSFITRDLGFETRQVFIAPLEVSTPPYTVDAAANFLRTVRDRVSDLPGVRSAAFTATPPFSRPVTQQIRLPGEAKDMGRRVMLEKVSKDYFSTLGIPMIHGRAFQDSDATPSGAAGVAVVSQTFATAFWKYQNPLGKVVVMPDDTRLLVIGVAKDVKTSNFDVSNDARVYLLQDPRAFTGSLLVRFDGEARSLAPVIARTIRDLDASQMGMPQTLQSIRERKAEQISPLTDVILIMAGLTLLLSVSGVYGTVAFSMSRRTREFGIRMALGATKGRILRSVLASGLRQVAIGLVFGVALALPAAVAFRRLIGGSDVFNWSTYCLAAIVLAIAALAACYIPARRAMRVDPMVALRYE
ncbi:MAG TPA: ADOP family duplicated permease [Candidatus Methylomirabilis sp.]|nr:ADOP family duplicated permease [Candidatus Methylomirabilis sp.]